MLTMESKLPSLPEIGMPDGNYTRLITKAEHASDIVQRSAAKAGRYITLALSPDLSWPEQFRYFTHALSQHCTTLSMEPEVQAYYGQLADLVRQHCGAEALRLACQEDDMYAARVALGQDRNDVEDDAEQFFSMLLGRDNACPAYFSEGDWAQLKLIRDQWI